MSLKCVHKRLLVMLDAKCVYKELDIRIEVCNKFMVMVRGIQIYKKKTLIFELELVYRKLLVMLDGKLILNETFYRKFLMIRVAHTYGKVTAILKLKLSNP